MVNGFPLLAGLLSAAIKSAPLHTATSTALAPAPPVVPPLSEAKPYTVLKSGAAVINEELEPLDTELLETDTLVELADELSDETLLGAIELGAVGMLEGAVLEGAVLEGATLDGTEVEGAELEGATLDGTELEGAELEGVGTIASLDCTEDTATAELAGT